VVVVVKRDVFGDQDQMRPPCGFSAAVSTVAGRVPLPQPLQALQLTWLLFAVLCCSLADALVPFEYVQQLESVSSTAPNAIGNIYAAPVLFEQDSSAVPGIVRATDYMWSGLAAQNLNSWFGIGFPISNYRYWECELSVCEVRHEAHMRRVQAAAALPCPAGRGGCSCRWPADGCRGWGSCSMSCLCLACNV
jgi:hypothetical protein